MRNGRAAVAGILGVVNELLELDVVVVAGVAGVSMLVSGCVSFDVEGGREEDRLW